MKKILILLSILVIGATSASAAGGVGVFGSYWDTEDLGPGFGGGVKFKTDIAEFFAFEVRASCITKFDEWDGDDELFVIPIEAGLFFNFPLGDEVPLTLYGGGGGGYAILPEADDIDYDDDFCFFGAGGLEFAMGEGASLFGEVQYRFLEIDGAETDDGDFDMDGELTGLSFNAGLLFRF
ncbi:MAG: outer membrane beta-barrel protein [Lentisphaerae bacterium]|nr:outer membrane beta-barrel protein [Lentisphaerota bacterium]